MYKPYPIFDFRQGKVTALNPWLLPQDAFSKLRNGHLKDGVLEKRRGYALFGQIVKVDTTTKVPTLQTNPVTGIFNHVSSSTQNLLAADKERVCKFVSSRVANVAITAFADYSGTVAGTVKATATGHGLETDDIATQSLSTNFNGTFNITYIDDDNYYFTDTWVSLASETGVVTQEAFLDLTENKIRIKPTDGVNADQDTQPSDGVTINGVTSGATATLATGGAIADYGVFGSGTAFGTLVFANGTVTGTFQLGEQLNSTGTLDTGDIYGYALAANSDEAFTGDNTKFYSRQNWDHDGVSDTTYITKDSGPIQLYDGAHLRQFSIDIGTDAARAGDNDVTRCLLVILFKERIIIFNTEESGISFLQRARWSSVKAPFSWPTANFKDAPTSDIITAADILGDELYVWFEGGSVRRFAWTGDSTNPFEWETVSDDQGIVAQMSLVKNDDKQYAVGPTRLQVCDGRDVLPADRKIPDFFLDSNQDSLPFSNGVLLEEERQIYFTYTSDTATSSDADQPNDGNVYPDSILVFNYEDLSFATYGIPVHTFGFSFVESDLTWNDVLDAWEVIDFAWDDRGIKSGFPTTLFGNHLGEIFQMNFGGSDDGEDIEFRAVCGEWNPYSKLGHKAKLGKTEFLCDVDPDVTFDVKSFVNTDTTEFQTKTITCESIGGAEKLATQVVDIFATANFHRIEITNNDSSNRPKIHAIVPYFKDVGGRLT